MGYAIEHHFLLNKWPEDLKNRLENNLAEYKQNPLELAWVLGKHLGIIFKLEKSWVEKNLGQILPKENDQYWENAFTAHLLFNKNLDYSLYDLLKTTILMPLTIILKRVMPVLGSSKTLLTFICRVKKILQIKIA